jgi:hypothetical protein
MIVLLCGVKIMLQVYHAFSRIFSNDGYDGVGNFSDTCFYMASSMLHTNKPMILFFHASQ